MSEMWSIVISITAILAVSVRSIELKTSYSYGASSTISPTSPKPPSSCSADDDYLTVPIPKFSRPVDLPGFPGPPGYIPIWSDGAGKRAPGSDYLTGMSADGWKVAQETHSMILNAAGQRSNTTGAGKIAAYGFYMLYVEVAWFQSLSDYGVPSTLPGGDIELLWSDEFQQPLLRAALHIAQVFQKLLDGLVEASQTNDYGDYIKEADYLAHDIHLRVEKGTFLLPDGYKISLGNFWQNAMIRIFLCDYFLGKECTAVRRQSYTWAVFAITSLNWHMLNGYETGRKARNEIQDFTLFDSNVKVVPTRMMERK